LGEGGNEVRLLPVTPTQAPKLAQFIRKHKLAQGRRRGLCRETPPIPGWVRPSSAPGQPFSHLPLSRTITCGLDR
jgi:hypothetical protein